MDTLGHENATTAAPDIEVPVPEVPRPECERDPVGGEQERAKGA